MLKLPFSGLQFSIYSSLIYSLLSTKTIDDNGYDGLLSPMLSVNHLLIPIRRILSFVDPKQLQLLDEYSRSRA